MIVYYFLIVLAAFLQAVGRGIFWPAFVVIGAAGRREAAEVYPLAFFGGLLADLITGHGLGLGSFALLVLAGGIFVFRSRFQFRRRWLIVFMILAEAVYNRLA